MIFAFQRKQAILRFLTFPFGKRSITFIHSKIQFQDSYHEESNNLQWEGVFVATTSVVVELHDASVGR